MATIRSMLDAGTTFSFELMPPRTLERERMLEVALEELEPLAPSFVSITYGAGGSTRERTHSLVKHLLGDAIMTPMAHLTCAAHTSAQLREILGLYKDDGLENVLALRGDPPLAGTVEMPDGELLRAVDLVDLARDVHSFCVAVAAHPEGHPMAPDVETDRKRQAEKLKKADFAITQFFFDADDYFRLVESMSALGVDKPIIPGVMPPINIKQLTKMAELSGAGVPAFIADRLESTDDPDEARKIGVDIATALCRRLLDEGAPGIHLYTMNKSTATREIYANLALDKIR